MPQLHQLNENYLRLQEENRRLQERISGSQPNGPALQPQQPLNTLENQYQLQGLIGEDVQLKTELGDKYGELGEMVN